MKLNSLVRSYEWAWSGDPAMDVPTRSPADDDAAWKERSEAWETRLTNARDTGVYDGVTKPGERLSIFKLRIIPEVLFRKVRDDVSAGTLGIHAANALLVKLAVRGVTNLCDFDGAPFVAKLGSEQGLGEVVSNDLLDLLAAYATEAKKAGFTGPDPITEMGNHIVVRQNGPLPK